MGQPGEVRSLAALVTSGEAAHRRRVEPSPKGQGELRRYGSCQKSHPHLQLRGRYRVDFW